MKLMNPLVTISIPIYNCADFLDACLNSVLAQTYVNIEVILVNDKTPDDSIQIAEGFIIKHQLENWRIIHLKENSGSSVARNTGIDAAKGKYIFFIDGDDTVTNDCISELVLMSEATGAEMTISQLECIKVETGKKSICMKIKTNYGLLEGNDLIFSEFSSGNLVTYPVNKLIVTDYLKHNDLYFVPGLFAQDELWTFHCVLKMTKIAIHKVITYTYFLHDKSVIHNRTKRNFDNWFTIGQYIDNTLKAETKPLRRTQIMQYLTDYKSLTLQMNWKAQKNEELWKESYRNYKKLSKLRWTDYLSAKFSKSIKKSDFFNRLPTDLGFRFFKWRYER